MEYYVFVGESQRGKDVLVSTDGYRYCHTRDGKLDGDGNPTRFWVCSVRNRSETCGAKVKQVGNVFTQLHAHTCAAREGILQASKVKMSIKEKARTNSLTSSSNIVDDALAEHVGSGPMPDLPTQPSLVRFCNKRRMSTRTRKPKRSRLELDTQNCDRNIVYHVFVGESQCGKDVLVSSDGYRYCHTRDGKLDGDGNPTRFWVCSVRNRSETCGAKVKQVGNVFTQLHAHTCAAREGIFQAYKVKMSIKEKVRTNSLTSSSNIVDDALAEHVGSGTMPDLPTQPSLVRYCNRLRMSTRPRTPKRPRLELDVGKVLTQVSPHTCAAREGILQTSKVKISIKEKARTNSLTSSSNIIDDALAEHVGPERFELDMTPESHGRQGDCECCRCSICLKYLATDCQNKYKVSQEREPVRDVLFEFFGRFKTYFTTSSVICYLCKKTARDIVMGREGEMRFVEVAAKERKKLCRGGGRSDVLSEEQHAKKDCKRRKTTQNFNWVVLSDKRRSN